MLTQGPRGLSSLSLCHQDTGEAEGWERQPGISLQLLHGSHARALLRLMFPCKPPDSHTLLTSQDAVSHVHSCLACPSPLHRDPLSILARLSPLLPLGFIPASDFGCWLTWAAPAGTTLQSVKGTGEDGGLPLPERPTPTGYRMQVITSDEPFVTKIGVGNGT